MVSISTFKIFSLQAGSKWVVATTAWHQANAHRAAGNLSEAIELLNLAIAAGGDGDRG
jgi:hypothetical protein